MEMECVNLGSTLGSCDVGESEDGGSDDVELGGVRPYTCFMLIFT